MAFSTTYNRTPRPLVDVTSLNLTCKTCQKQITQLPFNPTKKEDGTYGDLYCRDCNRDRLKKQGGTNGGYNNNYSN